MKTLVFDIETDGLLDSLTKLHCMWVADPATGEIRGYSDEPGYTPINDGLAWLLTADVLVGHNVIGFDLPAITKVYGVEFQPPVVVRDTMVCTSLMWPHIKESDFDRARSKLMPGNMIGRQSLEAWGYRLGTFKGAFDGGDWQTFSKDMYDYNKQDVEVTLALWKRIEQEAKEWDVPLCDDNPPPRKDCIALEHRVAAIVEKVQRHGVNFDQRRAIDLVATLSAKRQTLVESIQSTFKPRVMEEVFVPKVNNKSRGYVKGVPFTKRWEVVFNPGSRQEIGRRMIDLGWKPSAFGADGAPTINDEILKALPYPEAQLLAEYFVVDKRLGTIANGNEAWFRHERHGRLHGRIRSNGAHTGRMTHSSPNLAQVPANDAPYGKECRACFIADPGHVLVGCDADALELCDLAGYMAIYDGGDFIETALRGDKKLGTDMHSINAKLLGCTRDVAKTYVYALIYGSGDQNLGRILGFSGRRQMLAGRQSREALLAGIPALGSLVKAVQAAAETRGYLVGLDGRRLVARAANAALNTLLQSAGAVQMKRGLVHLYDTLQCFTWGKDYAIILLVHDEWQITCRPDLADTIGKAAASAITASGTFYSFRCPLTGSFKVGPDWSKTH